MHCAIYILKLIKCSLYLAKKGKRVEYGQIKIKIQIKKIPDSNQGSNKKDTRVQS